MFLYSTVIPDFLKIESWLRNSVHTMTPRHGSIGLGGGRVGFGPQGIRCQGYLATPHGILDASVGKLLSRFGFPRPSARFFFWRSIMTKSFNRNAVYAVFNLADNSSASFAMRLMELGIASRTEAKPFAMK